MATVTPTAPVNIGKRRKIKTITGREVYLAVLDEIVVPHGARCTRFMEDLGCRG
jgi:hypothetical protein